MIVKTSFDWNVHYEDATPMHFVADNAEMAVQQAIAYGLTLPNTPEIIVLERLGFIKWTAS